MRKKLTENITFSLPNGTIRKSIIVSPDSAHLAYAVQGQQGVYLEVNGQKASENYQSISGITFCPNSQRLAFVASYRNRLFLICDGIEYGPFDDIGETSPIFSPNSKHVAYTVRQGNQWFLLIDKKMVGGHYEGFAPGGIVFSADSKKVGYVIRRRGFWQAIENGKTHKEYPSILQRSWVFSPNSNVFTYIACLEGKQIGYNWVGKAAIVVNGELCEKWSHDDRSDQNGLSNEIYFSPDSRQIVYSVTQEQKFFFVINKIPQKKYNGLISGWGGNPQWKLLPEYGKTYFKSNSITFSPDSQHFAYATHGRDNQDFLIYDGEEISSHKAILNDPIVFSPDSKRFAYGAAEDEENVADDYPKQFLVVNEKKFKSYHGLPPVEPSFSPDSLHIAYVASTGKEFLLVVDDSQSYMMNGTPILGAKLIWDNPENLHTILALPQNTIQIVNYSIGIN